MPGQKFTKSIQEAHLVTRLVCQFRLLAPQLKTRKKKGGRDRDSVQRSKFKTHSNHNKWVLSQRSRVAPAYSYYCFGNRALEREEEGVHSQKPKKPLTRRKATSRTQEGDVDRLLYISSPT